MLGKIAGGVAAFVARRDLLVIGLVVLLTLGVGAGMLQVDMEDQTAIDDSVFSKTEVGQALDYMDANYDDDSDETAQSSVYVRPEDGNALSRESLVSALAYQQAVLRERIVRDELVEGDAIDGPPTRIGRYLAGDDADIEEQIVAIKGASEAELREAIGAVFQNPTTAGEFLPRSYEPGSGAAEGMRIRFEFEQAAVTQQQEPLPEEDAQRVLYETAADRPGMFTTGMIAQQEWDEAQILDVLWLIIPPALLLVLAVLAFAYRDLVDVVLGFVGISFSLVWFFGILGWLGIPAGFASIVGPVLIVALSIDFGLHVFMRYREQRGDDDGIREPMRRSTASIMVAFLLVAITAGVGFLANVTSPIGFIRAFGVVITLGVLSAVFIFVTLVPALKIRVDATLERFGVDRHKTALGTTGSLKPLLSAGVGAARRGAPVVIVLALLAGALGLVAFTEIDRQGFQEDFTDDGDWQTDLPEPFGWTAHETAYRQNLDYVQANFQSDVERDRASTLLIRGDVTDPTTLERVRVSEMATDDSDVTFKQGDAVPTRSPLSVMRTLAVENEEFANLLAAVAEENDQFEETLTAMSAEDGRLATALDRADGAGVTPLDDVGGDLTRVYDAMYRLAPEETAPVLERTDGEYRSMRVIIPVEQGLDVNHQGAEMHTIADETAGGTELSVVPVGFATVSNAGLGEIADSILWTMLLAFGGVALVLAGAYHVERKRPLLGVITVVPIVMVVGLVFGGMYVFDVPLTFITAFLVSITIGLGIDYNIHVSDRFVAELEDRDAPIDALYATVTGTGGALLGSALTSGGAFATLLIHPSPMFQSFGFIVVLALLLSFAVSVLVFPSMLLWWARTVEGRWTAHPESTEQVA